MLNALKAWKLGAYRITEKQIEKLSRIKPKGWLVGVIPSLEDKPGFNSLPNFLILSILTKSMLASKYGFIRIE